VLYHEDGWTFIANDGTVKKKVEKKIVRKELIDRIPTDLGPRARIYISRGKIPGARVITISI
jgi:hypothetical protein